MADEIEINVIDAGDGKNLAITFKYDQLLVEKVKSLPQRKWDKENKRWLFRPTAENLLYVKKWFGTAIWSVEALRAFSEAVTRQTEREKTAEIKAADEFDYGSLNGTPFKMAPFKHQQKALLLGRDRDSFAYLMDQGTGKTKVALDDAAYNWRQGKIDALLVIAPNSVKSNWVDPEGGEDEVIKHLAPDVPCNRGCWLSSKNGKQKKMYEQFQDRWGQPNTLHILAVNIEALHVDRVQQECAAFIARHKTMILVDESTRIKNRTAKRTKAAWKLRSSAKMARIMSGTPIIKSPLDAFAQFKFLDEDIIGFSNYYSFQHHFAVMGGYGGYQVLFYKNLEELSKSLDTSSFRVMKEECLDLPPKSYQRRDIEMSRGQAAAYSEMRDNMIVSLENFTAEEGEINATIVLTQLLRLQQITAGFLPVLDDTGYQINTVPIGSSNPKIEEAVEIIEQCNHKVIVWCRFVAEIKMLSEALKKEGIEHVTFYGETSEEDRVISRRRFQDADDPVKVFVGQIRTGGIGITLHRARTVIYLSNSFSTEDRVQSEDRAHRIGQEHPVQYIDLVCPGTIDTKVISILRNNKKISDEILKDGWRAWI